MLRGIDEKIHLHSLEFTMPVWHAALLGIVQGLTEFLPISSTAHLLLVQQLLGRSQSELENDPFTVVIQLGTLVAVFAYFRSDVLALIRGFVRDVSRGRLLTSATPEGRLVKLIVVGTIPVVIAGLLLKSWLKRTFYNAPSIAVVAIVFALLMWLAEWWIAQRQQRTGGPVKAERDITFADAIWVGLWQALALMPGGSRSGTTITAGLFAGLSRSAAARFSFLLSLPSILAAGLKELYDWAKAVRASPELQATVNEQLLALAVGTAVSAVVGYIAIAFLMRFLQRYSLRVFVGYRIALGIVILALVAGGMLTQGG